VKATPKGLRLHIGIFGRRNVGKSSVLNAVTRQAVSIVSPVAGTTTDPVEKPMELLPLGPVLFVDTAGIDDVGALGAQRVARTRAIFDRSDVAIVVAAAGEWGEFEEALLSEFAARKTPVIVMFNKCDLATPAPEVERRLADAGLPAVRAVASRGEGVLDLREALIRAAPDEFINAPPLLGDLVPPGELAVLVVPIDIEAPKGRLILPQVQAIRDVLDSDAYCLVVKERELRAALDRLTRPPALVVTDSQAFLKVEADTPREVPLTSFSILMARAKGDLEEFARGARAIDRLAPGDPVLVAEACSHHSLADDLGRVKIPRWLRQHVGGDLRVTHVQGHDFPDDPSPYKLVIHCGACMWNRRELLSRVLRCRRAGVPITNYGLAIAWSLGIFDRALSPFPALRERVAAAPDGGEGGSEGEEPCMKKKVYMVDDDVDLVATTRLALEAKGYVFKGQHDEKQLVENIRKFNPDVIILDVMFPDNPGAGFDMARTIRHQDDLKGKPVIMLSAVNTEGKYPGKFTDNDIDEIYLPITKFVDKPIDPAKLIKTIEKLTA
jgi:[FeFe] hydrogenase H-cluster maturation GTPase HydF